jgi:hypothetical protein
MRILTFLALLAVAVSCSPSEEHPGPRFAPIGADVLRDTRTGLEWPARDSDSEQSWPRADRFCREMKSEQGGRSWRLPSIEELAGLYDVSMQQSCGEKAVCRIDGAIDLTSPYQWSATAPQPERRGYFDFAHGSRLTPLIRASLTRRVLCVRG